MRMSARSGAVARPAMRMAPAVRRPLVVVASKGGEEGGKTFGKDAYGIIAGNANFSLLGSALTKAGLGETLMGAGPFTVFAPNDDAFGAAAKKLGITKVDLLALPNMKDILLYHVVSGNVSSAELKEGMSIKTVNGKSITYSNGTVNGAKITKKDFKTANGVIHVIDAVLLP
ncbi:hypothetical protein FOA52_007703 [Chlamydomonas sp. UWO 241]|nr:hypothetical protein FOA52_007703 [Chlamydomonas sp. UWO 241]